MQKRIDFGKAMADGNGVETLVIWMTVMNCSVARKLSKLCGTTNKNCVILHAPTESDIAMDTVFGENALLMKGVEWATDTRKDGTRIHVLEFELQRWYDGRLWGGDKAKPWQFPYVLRHA